MTRQLLVYENPQPVAADTHRDLSVRALESFAFAAGLTSVPLVAAEFEAAAQAFPIVFAGEGEALFPAAILGLKQDTNLFVTPEGKWDAAYVPAFLRRYPFVFTNGPQDGTLTLCLDMAYPGINRDGRGERMFDADGNRTAYLGEVLRFVSEYQSQHDVTVALIRLLREHDLLEPATATLRSAAGEQVNLTGFQRVAEGRLAALDDATLAGMVRSGVMKAIHLHLASLGRLQDLLGRLPREA